MDYEEELAWLDATALAALMRCGEIHAVEVLEATERRLARLNPRLNAVVTRIAPGSVEDGPFSGVPFLVKDLALEVAGTRFTEGSRWLRDNVSTHDQELAVRFRRAGLMTIGKTNTPEFGLSPTCEPTLFGPAHNPFHPDYSTGGSSGGAAAAVAAGIVPMAHGNDLLGSLRFPAAHCGVFGLKPTRGRVPLGPEYGDVVSGLAAEHVLTRSVRDSALLLDVVAGPSPGDPYSAPAQARPFAEEVRTEPGRLRIAVMFEPRSNKTAHPDHDRAVRDLARKLEGLGHDVEEAWPDGLGDDTYGRAVHTLARAAAAWIFEYWKRRLGRVEWEQLEPATRVWFEEGTRISAGEYLLAVGDVQRIARKVARWFARYDVWLTPTTGAPPAPLGTLVGTESDPRSGSRRISEHFLYDTSLANVIGSPAMSLPWGLDTGGLPIGMHFLGRFGDEATLLRLAGQLELAFPWSAMRPPLSLDNKETKS